MARHHGGPGALAQGAFPGRLTLISGKYDSSLCCCVHILIDLLLPCPANARKDPRRLTIITDEAVALRTVAASAHPLGAQDYDPRTMRTSLGGELEAFSDLSRK